MVGIIFSLERRNNNTETVLGDSSIARRIQSILKWIDSCSSIGVV